MYKISELMARDNQQLSDKIMPVFKLRIFRLFCPQFSYEMHRALQVKYRVRQTCTASFLLTTKPAHFEVA